jgi:hypothetical protein
MDELLRKMRAFASEPGALFYVVKTKTRGSVPIWADDIRATASDEQLRALVLARINS